MQVESLLPISQTLCWPLVSPCLPSFQPRTTRVSLKEINATCSEHLGLQHYPKSKFLKLVTPTFMASPAFTLTSICSFSSTFSSFSMPRARNDKQIEGTKINNNFSELWVSRLSLIWSRDNELFCQIEPVSMGSLMVPSMWLVPPAAHGFISKTELGQS